MNSENENGGVGKAAAATAAGGAQAAAVCRQSSTRWTPTTEQIRILKDLYYNYGVRSPSAEQIQRISAKLRQYGKIEGKNVFYWFQNHKARERQKKRFLSDPPPPPPPPPPHQSHLAFHPTCPNNISPAGLSASSSSSAPGLMAFGQMTNYGYNSVSMEKKFRDFSVSAVGGSSVAGAPIGHNYGWITVDPYSASRALFEKRVFYGENTEEDHGDEEEYEDDDEDGREMETLPLFPMHGDESINGGSNGDHHHHHNNGWRNEVYMGAAAASRTSLELTLNSYSNWVTPASP